MVKKHLYWASLCGVNTNQKINNWFVEIQGRSHWNWSQIDIIHCSNDYAWDAHLFITNRLLYMKCFIFLLSASCWKMYRYLFRKCYTCMWMLLCSLFCFIYFEMTLTYHYLYSLLEQFLYIEIKRIRWMLNRFFHFEEYFLGVFWKIINNKTIMTFYLL